MWEKEFRSEYGGSYGEDWILKELHTTTGYLLQIYVFDTASKGGKISNGEESMD